MSMSWQDLRSSFPFLQRRPYFFAGAQAPLSREVREAMEGFLDLWEDKAWRFEPAGWGWFDEAQALLAAILGCPPQQVIAAEGTSHALNLATAMVLARWTMQGRPPRNVVFHHVPHPASSLAWVNAQRLGAPLELRWPRPEVGEDPIDALARSIDDATLAVVATHVSHLTGERLDVSGLAKRFPDRSWALLLDAAQSAGALSLVQEVARCDFVALPAYKWLFGPAGVGFLVAQPFWLAEVGPPFVGWALVKDPLPLEPQRLELTASGTAFRLGIANFIGMAGAVAGLRLSRDAGRERIAERIEHLTTRFLDGVTASGYSSPTPSQWSKRAGVIALAASEPGRLMDTLLDDGVEVGIEEGKLRVDIHAYNSEDEIDRLLDRLRAHAPLHAHAAGC